MMIKLPSDGSSTAKTSEFSTVKTSVKSKKLAQEWVNSSPSGKMADVAKEPSSPFSGSFCSSVFLQLKQLFLRLSSTQPLNTHSNLNTHGQIEINFNLPVHEPLEPSCGTNVTNNAHVANKIMQELQQPQ